MFCQNSNNVFVIEAENYVLKLMAPPQPSYLFYKKTNRVFAFIAGGDCAKFDAWDNSSESSDWQMESANDKRCILFREEKSALWNKKQFFIDATEDCIEFYHELNGNGLLDEVRFFRSCYDNNEYGFAGDFDEILSAAPSFREQLWYHPSAQVVISNGNDLSPVTGGHALASVPHVMGLHDRRDKTLLGAGIFAEQGEYLWDDLVWNPEAHKPPTDYSGDISLAGGWAIRYCGKKEINGDWRSPGLMFTFPDKWEDMLVCALNGAYDKNYLPRPQKRHIADWWNEPIYCTWHDQTSFAKKSEANWHIPAPNPGEFCTQELTEHWLQRLIDHNAKPGIVILDDKWQKSKLDAEVDTAKWPDMRGWIEKCHDRGIKVFLWGLAWHNEDIPLEEAITQDGKIICGDVTNPLYEARLRRKIHTYFSDEPGCINADGVKIDGMMMLPTGKGLKNSKNIWGLELQRYFLEIVYDESKKAKADACISTFSANPYLDEFTDMVRLADMYVYRLSTECAMRQRKAVFEATHPYVLVDTDGQINHCINEDFINILDVEEEIGIPTVYSAEYIRRNRFFIPVDYRKWTEDEYKKISEVFAGFRQKKQSKHGV